MEKWKGRKKATKHESLGNNRFVAYAYKPTKVFNVSFGLETTSSNISSEILTSDVSWKQSVTSLIALAKASGTMENYELINEKLADSCGNKGYCYPKFDEKAALHFVIHLDNDKSTLATLRQVKPVVSMVEKLAGKEDSAWTDYAICI
jgi:hypothetical protein